TRAQAQALEAAKRAASELQMKYNSLRTSVQRQRSELMQVSWLRSLKTLPVRPARRRRRSKRQNVPPLSCR
ncbi:hypothetical protein V5H41_28400, partial [Salmonella enterica]